MIANTQNISSILNVTDLPDQKVQLGGSAMIIQHDQENTAAENDYEYTRRNLYDIIEKGQYALDEMIEFARQAQNPRAFEVVSTLVSGLVDANQKLMHLSKQIKDIKTTAEKKEEKITNNNLFVGSTAELQKLLRGE
jgi:hypothetical protein